ncbi:MAG: hypothetical protein K2G12_03090 [Prevotella sp.]|nr:hypothetical protein [Prevotella sp.]
MANHLWKVVLKRSCGKLPAGVNVEIIESSKPSVRQIEAAIMAKYGADFSMSFSSSSFDYIQLG